jgi:hypothetical protein
MYKVRVNTLLTAKYPKTKIFYHPNLKIICGLKAEDVVTGPIKNYNYSKDFVGKNCINQK